MLAPCLALVWRTTGAGWGGDARGPALAEAATGHRLVGGDHQLLHDDVRDGLPRTRDRHDGPVLAVAQPGVGS